MLRLQRRLGGRKRTLMELRQLRAFLERSSEPPATGGFGDGYAKKMSSALAAIIFTATLIAIVLRPWKISEAWSAGAGAALDRWTDYYEREGIDQIAFGAVILRCRSGGSNWVRADSIKGGHGSSSALVLRVFEAEDHLRALSDEGALLDVKFALVPEHRLEQRLASSGGKWQLQDATLSLSEGIGFQGGLDIHTALLLQSLDGASTLRQVVRKVGSSLELSRDETSAFSETAIAMAKRLYQLGFLVRSKS